MLDIKITKTTAPKEKPKGNLGFGRIFTDHMFVMDYTQGVGWHDPRIVPYQDLTLSPAAMVFHYGQEMFEGLKAYKGDDGANYLFRPDMNAKRTNDTNDRLCIPRVPEEDYVQAVKAIVSVDQDWIPTAPGTSLYIRPFEFCTDVDLGLHSIAHAKMMIILSPVGSYLAGGLKPVDILIEDADVRAVRGGTGYAKCGGNYAAANRAAAAKAEEKGYAQVLWLDGVHRKYVEEVGSMNVMFKIGGKVVTPALTGSVLPGITRRSCIQLLKDKGYEVEERLVSVDELMEAMESGALEEAWGCGTAAVISPIGGFAYKDKKFTVNHNEIGPCSQDLYDTLTGIQWGTRPDDYGWTVKVPKK